ncbi:Fe-S cluster assembly protein SufD [Acaricomes phytoseiuli]|nr:Fe-S cluster assembly protein SufD [Acaricomes phytoseiuli]MCW1250598.1 Fe-S cluster assembly protein SufD [Acaricomes phytoseiuli]
MTEEGETLVESKVDYNHNHGTQVMASRAERRTSFDLSDFSVPTGLEEEWRFTPVKKFTGLFAQKDSTLQDSAAKLQQQTILPEGVLLEEIDTAAARQATSAPAADRSAAAALANSAGAMQLTVPAGTVLSEPVRIKLTGQGAGETVFEHWIFRIGAGAEAVIVLEHEGEAEYSQLVAIEAEAGAQLTFVSTQRWADSSVHASQQDVLVGRDAVVKHIAVSLGGAAVRVNVNARYAEEGGEVELFGLYYADSGQHLEHRTFVDHNVPHGVSNVLYKGALQGAKAHTVWVGDVLIRKAAIGTDSYEKNQNLILTDGARADSVPNLEIETGLIAGAGHASSTGRFDDEHLFYLMARGIPDDVARRLVVRGYLNEIIQKIRVPDLEDELVAALEDELNASQVV